MNSRLLKSIRLAVMVLLVGSLAILGIGILRNPKSLDWDSRRGVLAAMQFEQGVSPSIVQVTLADPDDLTRSVAVPEGWRSPGYQAVPFGLRKMGMSWAAAIQVTVFVFSAMGVIAWMACYLEVSASRRNVSTLALLMVLSPIVVDFMRVYDSGDLLLFGFIPVMIWVNMIAVRQRSAFMQHGLCAVGGFLSTIVFILKYSGIFVGMGVGTAWVLLAVSSPMYRRAFVSWVGGALGGVCLIIGLGYPWGPTPSSMIGQSIRWKDGFLALGAWPLSMTDSAEFVSRVGQILGGTELIMRTVWCPFVGLLFVGAIIGLFRREIFTNLDGIRGAVRDESLVVWWPGLLLIIPFIVDTLCYAGIVFMGGGVEVCARLARPSGLLMFSLIAGLLWRRVCDPHAVRRVIAFSLLALFIASGPVIGASRMIRTAWSRAHKSRVQSGQVQPLRIEGVGVNLATQSEFYTELRGALPSTRTVLLVIAPEHVLEIPSQRMLLVYAIDNGYTASELAALRFRGQPSSGVAMLLPTDFHADGRALALQTAFQDVDRWTSVSMRSDPRWTLWLAVSHHMP